MSLGEVQKKDRTGVLRSPQNYDKVQSEPVTWPVTGCNKLDETSHTLGADMLRPRFSEISSAHLSVGTLPFSDIWSSVTNEVSVRLGSCSN